VNQYDLASYEIRHFAHLLAQGNPNVISALWVKPEEYLILEDEGRALIRHRELFMSKRLYNTFCGYAHSQLKRMTAWRDQAAAGCLCRGIFHEVDCPLRKEKGRGSAKLYATGFMGEKRKNLVEKYGYDTKNAAHLVRLLSMGIEALAEGKLHVDRTGRNANDLMAIKQGKWTIEEVLLCAEAGFNMMHSIYNQSPLPDQPNLPEIERLLMEILCHAHGTKAILTSASISRSGYLSGGL